MIAKIHLPRQVHALVASHRLPTKVLWLSDSIFWTTGTEIHPRSIIDPRVASSTFDIQSPHHISTFLHPPVSIYHWRLLSDGSGCTLARSIIASIVSFFHRFHTTCDAGCCTSGSMSPEHLRHFQRGPNHDTPMNLR
jgi:hypothetical protein